MNARTFLPHGLVLPDPFMTGQLPPSFTRSSSPSWYRNNNNNNNNHQPNDDNNNNNNNDSSSNDINSSVIDLTEDTASGIPAPEIIDLDSLPDPIALPTRPVRLPTPTPNVSRARTPALSASAFHTYSDAMFPGLFSSVPITASTTATMATASDSDRPASDAQQRARRREWLLHTAQMRQFERDQRLPHETRDPAAARESRIGRLLDLSTLLASSGAGSMRARVRGPRGGGLLSLHELRPEHFQNGGSVEIVPDTRGRQQQEQDHPMAHFQRPVLDYEIHNHLFPEVWISAQEVAEFKYVAPAPLKEPFTGTFTADDLLICPGCRSELGGTEGGEMKRRIYVSKCGHVYCGMCGHDLKTASGKKQGIVCRAEGCGKKITKSKIFEAYV